MTCQRERSQSQNRLIAIDASKEHRGNAPDKGEVRITLAFKTNVL